jgi:hypothetical protein
MHVRNADPACCNSVPENYEMSEPIDADDCFVNDEDPKPKSKNGFVMWCNGVTYLFPDSDEDEE